MIPVRGWTIVATMASRERHSAPSWPCRQVDKNVTTVAKALNKVGRFFDASGLEGCSKIASSVKSQVRHCFDPPRLTMFENGMVT